MKPILPVRARSLADRLVQSLPYGLPGLFNPWRDVCEEDIGGNGPEAKLLRLAAHLSCEPKVIAFGEAAGYQGKRHSGLAFTSERLLLNGAIPRVPAPGGRLTTRHLPYSEPSATIVWKTLYRLGLAEQTVLWNALPLHPHRPGEFRSNRTPTSEELAFGREAARLMLEAFPKARIVAIGKKSAELLAAMGVQSAATVRHPANGGATEFADGMETVLATLR